MAILHGSWLVQPQGGYLFVWGEIWRPMTPAMSSQTDTAASHPMAMTQAELIAFLRSRSIFGESSRLSRSRANEKWHKKAIALPSQTLETGEPIYPVLSTKMLSEGADASTLSLHLWQVEGLCLHPLEAIQFLQALPLGSFKASDAYVGGDLRYWAQVSRWILDLLVRCKFLPTLHRQLDGTVVAGWQPLLDSALDQARLEKFTQLMPSACRTYQHSEVSSKEKPNEQLTPDAPKELLLGFLGSVIDAQVRSGVGNSPLPAVEPIVREWLQALSTASNTLKAEPTAIGRLEVALQTWTSPVQDHLVAAVFASGELRTSQYQQNRFRTCFLLQPPASGDENWSLEYSLQATGDPEFLVDAETIWNHPLERLVFKGRTIEHHQETFLSGLGLAARLYPPIESSLHDRRPQFCRLTPVQVYEFIKAGAWRLKDSGLGVVMPSSLMPAEGENRHLGLKIRSSTTPGRGQSGLQSWLSFEWELAIGDRTISKQEFDRLIALQSPLVQVNGEWIALQPSDVKAAQLLLATPKDQMALSLEDALRLSTGDTKVIEKLPVVSFEAAGPLQQLLTTLTNNQAVEAIAPPANFQGQLRPYQARGVGWLSFLERWGLGACLADDMGLGKTIQCIAFLLNLQEEEKLEAPTLLVCPTSVLGNWEREVKKFGPTLKVVVHHGDKRPKGKALEKAVKGKDLVITSYSLAFRDAKDLQSVSWRGVVLDEAQNIKNPQAKQSQAVRQLKAGFRIALTGTPVENRLAELWSILDFLNPGYLGTRDFFQRRFALPIEKYGDMASLQTLRSLVSPFILRRLKSDRNIIQDLPEKQEMTVFCGLSAEQAALYQKLVEESLVEIDNSEGVQRKGIILALLIKLKQICNHPAQFLKEKELVAQRRSGKLQRLEEMLEEALLEGYRALIFTQFAEWGKLLQPYLEKHLGWETLFLYGGTRKQQREEMIDQFQNDPEGPRIFILSLKAGGTGLNLTRANHVFHFDRWWNPAVENQATDRVFRIGQTRNVQVHKFTCTGTLEERINEMIESKKALAEQVVGAGEQWITELNTDQLRNLLLLDRTAVIDDE
ncbi:DEAD/DEAH box helicase [Coleofasciculus sp. H7-2]|uniref:DEAD/DEAH box helicase n=1 Tax=Coleofasciculus sp. H7-2 TaxID=3351545 RepID=UPI00366A6FC0